MTVIVEACNSGTMFSGVPDGGGGDIGRIGDGPRTTFLSKYFEGGQLGTAVYNPDPTLNIVYYGAAPDDEDSWMANWSDGTRWGLFTRSVCIELRIADKDDSWQTIESRASARTKFVAQYLGVDQNPQMYGPSALVSREPFGGKV